MSCSPLVCRSFIVSLCNPFKVIPSALEMNSDVGALKLVQTLFTGHQPKDQLISTCFITLTVAGLLKHLVRFDEIVP